MIQPGGSRYAIVLTALVLLCGGCTSLRQWAHNCFKVGPNYHEPAAPVEAEWIDARDPRVVQKPIDCLAWWTVFNDPQLNQLIDTAYRQNLNLKTAVTRILQAQAQRNVQIGNLLPQTQTATGTYVHAQISKNFATLPSIPGLPLNFPNTFDLWATGFNASWELDFWGLYRRKIESANADLAADVEAYHDALVMLLSDVATAYVQLRTFQQRLAYARRNVQIQKGSLGLAEVRFKEGATDELDVAQARSNLAQTESLIPPLEIGLRQSTNRLCILLGMPPRDLADSLETKPIPRVSPEAAVGVPADLLHQRPDVRQARFQVASQSAQIGVAEAEFYPHFGVTGFLGYAASDIRKLFEESSFTGIIMPNFRWNILNYGRVLNNVRKQQASLQEKVLTYQQTVLNAGREVEDGLVAFLRYQVQTRSLEASVKAGQRSVELVLAKYRGGAINFNRVFTTQSQLVTQQDSLASAQGNIALSLINVYRALGGGWQVFQQHDVPHAESAAPAPAAEKPAQKGPELEPDDTPAVDDKEDRGDKKDKAPPEE